MSISKKLAFLLVYTLIPLPFVGLYLGGGWTFIILPVLFALIPLVDYFVTDPVNPDKEEEKLLSKQAYFRYITYAYVPLQAILLTCALYIVATKHLTALEFLGFVISFGMLSGGIGINLSHELMHKNSRLQQFLSKVLLSMVCYGHFFIEHVRGHHVNVATPNDPATARLGESLYQFLPRTMYGSLCSAWHLESKRMTNKQLPLYHYTNHFWWIFAAPFVLAISIYLLGGAVTLAFFFVQSFFAILMLETVNYIEHYGLLRKKLDNGHYEKVQPEHSWNANHWLTNLLMFHLQRHSDHHTFGARPYQILRHMPQSPQLPSGYLGMMVLAFIPPLWFKVMNPKVMAYRQQQQISQIEVETDVVMA